MSSVANFRRGSPFTAWWGRGAWSLMTEFWRRGGGVRSPTSLCGRPKPRAPVVFVILRRLLEHGALQKANVSCGVVAKRRESVSRRTKGTPKGASKRFGQENRIFVEPGLRRGAKGKVQLVGRACVLSKWSPFGGTKLYPCIQWETLHGRPWCVLKLVGCHNHHWLLGPSNEDWRGAVGHPAVSPPMLCNPDEISAPRVIL